MYNSTNFLRLTLSQYGKAYGLPCFIAIDWKTFPYASLYISKIGLSPNLYNLLIYGSGLIV